MTTANDRTRQIVEHNLARIALIGADAQLLHHQAARARLASLLTTRSEAPTQAPVIVLRCSDNRDYLAATQFAREMAGIGRILTADRHGSHFRSLFEIYREEVDSDCKPFEVKRRMLILSCRHQFVKPFTGGAGTTCAAWTRHVAVERNGKQLRGFMVGSVSSGFCPVECPFCYLNGFGMDIMNIALNLEDLEEELITKFQGYPYPINFGETGGLVEVDEFFAGRRGEGSLVQHVIDACDHARAKAFFLTKVRYPKYLNFRGHVQVGVSLMPEPVRTWLAPHGSPTDELLASLGWAVAQGAKDPVVRLSMVWQQRDAYPELLSRCRELLGTSGWRLTLDITRFTPSTAMIIARRYPEEAERLAEELDPTGKLTLEQLAAEGRDEKKVRPPIEHQNEMYRWVRDQLNRVGCRDVLLTPCKGNPDELLPLVHDRVIRAMPCACYGTDDRPLTQIELPQAQKQHMPKALPENQGLDA